MSTRCQSPIAIVLGAGPASFFSHCFAGRFRATSFR